MLWSQDIHINSYELLFKPFAYKLSIEGNLEINSPYTIGAQILVGKMTWPNQVIDLIDIVPDKKHKCKTTTSSKCSVFRFHAHAQLSGNKYLSREFAQLERIPIQLTFDFNSDNLESFKSYNYTFRPPHTFQNQNYKFSEYVSDIKLLQINTHLNYQNSFVIENKRQTNNIKHVSIPTQWAIRNGVQHTTYQDIAIKFANYQNLNNTYITDWFSIKTANNVYLHDSNEVDVDSTYIPIPSSELKQKYENGWKSYYLNGNLQKINGEYKYRKDHINRGIFFDEKVNGYLTSKFKILVNNHGYTLTVKNPFSFSGRTSKYKHHIWKTYVKSKNDDYFKDLHNFRFVEL